MRVLNCLNPAERERAVTVGASAIKAGGLVVFPTESAYLVGTDAFSPSATDLIRTLRGIGRATPLPVLVRDAGVIDGVASPASLEARELAAAFWPGGLTLIVPKSPSIRWELGGDPRHVQLRCPLQPVALELIAGAGPVVTSIAKRAGGTLITRAGDAADEKEISIFLDYGELNPAGGPLPSLPSTVVDCTGEAGEPVRVLRAGAVTTEDLAGVLGYTPAGPNG